MGCCLRCVRCLPFTAMAVAWVLSCSTFEWWRALWHWGVDVEQGNSVLGPVQHCMTPLYSRLLHVWLQLPSDLLLFQPAIL